MWHVRVTFVPIETHQYLPFLLLLASCRHYKCVHCWRGNATMGFLCIVIELQNILFTPLTILGFEYSECLMFIGPCIIAIVDERKTNLMSPAILFYFLCTQHVSDINISIFRSLRLCWWITTSVVLFSVRCVLELLLRAVLGGVSFAGLSLQN